MYVNIRSNLLIKTLLGFCLGLFCLTLFAEPIAQKKQDAAKAAWPEPVLLIQKWKTNNGAEVYYVHTPQLPMVDIQVVFAAGSSRDNNKPGIAQFTNSILNEGSATLNADQIATNFDNVGAIYSADVDRDMATVGLRSLVDPKFLNPALQTFATVLSSPSFPPNAFERVQKQLLIAIDQDMQSPMNVAKNAFYQTVYGNQPYGHPVLGTKGSVSKLTANDLQNFYKQYYVAKNAMIAIVGNIDEARAKAIAEQVIGKLPAGDAAPPLPIAKPLQEAANKSIKFPSQQTTVILGQVGINQKDPDYFPLLVGNHILGGSGLVSQLVEEVRAKHGLVYGIMSGFAPLEAHGPFAVVFQTRTNETQNALDLTHTTLDDFLKTGPTDQELEAAKKNIIGGFPLTIASNSDIVGQLVNIGFYHLDQNYLDTYRMKVQGVTAQQVRDAMQKHINPKALATITVGETEEHAQQPKKQ